MEIKSLASSSKGNCYLISDGSSRLMVECGIPIDRVRDEIPLTCLDGCLISHDHKDHCKYVKDIAPYCDIYASPGTIAVLDLGAFKYRGNPLIPGRLITIKSFKVLAFQTKHDAADPVGFLIYSTVTEETLFFATDTFYISQQFSDKFDYIMIECNYQLELLEKNLRRELVTVAASKRLLSSHMEFENVKNFLKKLDLEKTKKIYLLHLSNRNSNAEEMKKGIMELTGKPVEICAE